MSTSSSFNLQINNQQHSLRHDDVTSADQNSPVRATVTCCCQFLQNQRYAQKFSRNFIPFANSSQIHMINPKSNFSILTVVVLTRVYQEAVIEDERQYRAPHLPAGYHTLSRYVATPLYPFDLLTAAEMVLELRLFAYMPPRRRGRATRKIPIESEGQIEEGERIIPILRRARQVDDEVDVLAARVDEMELIMARFQRMNPQMFDGDESSSDTESWLQHITGLFDRVRYMMSVD
ncbi:hypothetical protein F511_18887 [Dorcoceras hygrometricum]|uniref:Uncharacterized protein n=1 Tax=Dorcoceras hygrometricum TaxID=472368 RepID=A0A2Z7DCZ6_9LAMI|nr:hypothetical protein F511_18887 [Dorcoceras hygrometricum]